MLRVAKFDTFSDSEEYYEGDLLRLRCSPAMRDEAVLLSDNLALKEGHQTLELWRKMLNLKETGKGSLYEINSGRRNKVNDRAAGRHRHATLRFDVNLDLVRVSPGSLDPLPH